MFVIHSLSRFVQNSAKSFLSTRRISSKVPREDCTHTNLRNSALETPLFDSAGYISHKNFDVTVPDIDENELSEIGAAFGVHNLSPGSYSSEPFPVTGQIYGRNMRLMVPLICRHVGNPNAEACNVWFLVDSGAPYSYLSVKTLEVIVGESFTHSLHNITIQDEAIAVPCHTSKHHFAEANLLGVDYLRKLRLGIMPDWEKYTFHLVKSNFYSIFLYCYCCVIPGRSIKMFHFYNTTSY